jgi:hypothetical protein
MLGPTMLVRTLTKATRTDREGQRWQYRSRSDHHSKVACRGMMLDLLLACPLLRRHVAAGSVGFGINHEMRDFARDRKKNLDLVLCTPAEPPLPDGPDLVSMGREWALDLDDEAARALDEAPRLPRVRVGSVLLALEAKACMTAHQRALPRLYDELNSSHQTVHAATDQAIAAGFVMVNGAPSYLSPDLNKTVGAAPNWSHHDQPRDAGLVVEKVRQLPRRARVGDVGYDALAITVISCGNDGGQVTLADAPPAPQPGDIHHYGSMIDRVAHIYATRFKDLA